MRPLTGGIPRIVFIVPLPDIPRISDKTGLREWGVLLEKWTMDFSGFAFWPASLWESCNYFPDGLAGSPIGLGKDDRVIGED